MKLRWVLLALLTPMVGLLGFYVWVQIDRLDSRASEAGQVYGVIEEVQALRSAQYQVAQEMALAAGVIGSFGEAGLPDYEAQILITDSALAQLDGALPVLTAQAPEAAARLASLPQALSAARDDATEMMVPPSDSTTTYIGFLTDLDMLAEAALSIQADRAVLDRVRALAALAEVRLWSARESALGAAALTEWAFNTVSYSEFLTAIRLEGIGLSDAGRLSAQSALAQDLTVGPEWEGLQTHRNAIFRARLGSGDWEALGLNDWIAAQTAWQGALDGVETALAEQTLALAGAARIHAHEVRQQQLWLAIIATALVVGLAVLIFEFMSHRIRRLCAVLNHFAEDRFDRPVPCQSGGSEISDLARSIEELKVKTLAIRAENENIRAANEAELNARHQQVVDLVTEGLRALAEADLTRDFQTPLAPEYDAIRLDFNTAVARLRRVLGALAETVRDLDTGASTLRATAGDLADRTLRQVDTIQAAGDAVNGLVTAQGAARTALSSAKGLADEARLRADESHDVVHRAVEAMDRISGSSDRIAQISAMIEDISFQTNLLALNAGVEAARAGTAGKGFAVVAEEVRELAGRSSIAAQEIKTLIAESGREVKTGVDLVGQTGTALQAIRDQVLAVDETLGGLAQTSDGQSRSLDDVRAAMSELHGLTGGNTKVADDSRTASADLARQAQELSRLVGQFILDQATQGAKQAA